MKVTVKENENETFKPITIELVIESEEELCNLYHRVNLDKADVNEKTEAGLKFEADASDYDLWEVLDNEIQNLRK
jgi:hypothetical protein